MDMIASTRRSFVAALLGMGMLGGRPLSGPLLAAPDGPLPLPDRPLRLTRVLTRGLGESGSPGITVRRWWDVMFERQGRGLVVSGRQLEQVWQYRVDISGKASRPGIARSTMSGSRALPQCWRT